MQKNKLNLRICGIQLLNPYKTVVSHLKFGNFTLSFGRLRQRILLKCVPHVQHDDFSSFNQSDCFLASSLPLSSSLRKLPNVLNCSSRPPSVHPSSLPFLVESEVEVLLLVRTQKIYISYLLYQVYISQVQNRLSNTV